MIRTTDATSSISRSERASLAEVRRPPLHFAHKTNDHDDGEKEGRNDDSNKQAWLLSWKNHFESEELSSEHKNYTQSEQTPLQSYGSSRKPPHCHDIGNSWSAFEASTLEYAPLRHSLRSRRPSIRPEAFDTGFSGYCGTEKLSSRKTRGPLANLATWR